MFDTETESFLADNLVSAGNLNVGGISAGGVDDVWVGGNDGIHHWDGAGWTHHDSIAIGVQGEIKQVARDGAGTIYAAFAAPAFNQTTLAWFDGTTWYAQEISTVVAPSQQYDMAVGPDGLVYIGTSGGLLVYAP